MGKERAGGSNAVKAALMMATKALDKGATEKDRIMVLETLQTCGAWQQANDFAKEMKKLEPKLTIRECKALFDFYSAYDDWRFRKPEEEEGTVNNLSGKLLEATHMAIDLSANLMAKDDHRKQATGLKSVLGFYSKVPNPAPLPEDAEQDQSEMREKVIRHLLTDPETRQKIQELLAAEGEE